MDEESLAVLTTPCIGAALFPDVLAIRLTAHPRARVALSEHGWQDDGERRHPADGFVLAVLPTLSHPQASGMQERLLWREPMLAVVPVGHELARLAAPSTDEVAAAPPVRAVISPAQLAGYPLVDSAMSANAGPEIVSMLADRGLDTAPRSTVDAPQTLVAMVRSGVGIGIANAVALDNTDTTGVVLLGFDDPEMIREVAAYWYDELLVSEVGRALLQGLLDAALPHGAVAIGAGASPSHS
jgi:DNA-binding transcriptional LysR family regulator